MGQFKPMTKMMTTEPSVILKLKKGGFVNAKEEAGEKHGYKAMGSMMDKCEDGDAPKKPSMSERRKSMSAALMKKGGKMAHKADGGMMAPPAGMGASMAPRRRLGAPMEAPAMSPAAMAAMRKQIAARRSAMGAPAMAPVGQPPAPMMPPGGAPMMKKGGSATEMKKISALEKELHRHESMSASKAHKGMMKKATGGVVMGAAGYATGGVIKGNGGGYKDGGSAKGVKLGNGGGYKSGGAAKKQFADGGMVDDGKAVKMPEHKVSKPVSNDRQSGTFKSGGKVGKYKDGDTVEDMSKGAYDKSIGPDKEDMDMAKTIRGIPRALYQGAKKMFGMDDTTKAPGAVTKTEKSVTVAPAKKRGGSC